MAAGMQLYKSSGILIATFLMVEQQPVAIYFIMHFDYRHIVHRSI